MSESDSASPNEVKESGSVLYQGAAWLGGLLILYAISFGPAIYLTMKLARAGVELTKTVEMLYQPHIWLALNWPPYMEYAEFWLNLGMRY